ncbi:MAG: hypothetical protein M1828_001959 [Chrysothrix sp. TS-e1954]|nr:MAG: hypothetical protein M1828_001959 [Chrysothrix sp. TS-e1954]
MDEYVTAGVDHEQPRTRWRFKRRKLSHESSDETSDFESKFHTEPELNRRRHRHHHHRHRRRAKAQPARPAKPAKPANHETPPQSPPNDPAFDPDAAFRESLFDAMADDEGAAFWEGVYGQPIHTYPDLKEGPTGAAEKMTDEEYVAWVRHQMWQKTHEGILEEHQQREADARRAQHLREKERRAEAERRSFNRQMEQSLKRAEERKLARKWQESWVAYERAWEHVGLQMSRASRDSAGGAQQVPRLDIPWPVMSGRMADVCKASVEKFLRQGPPRGKDGEVDLRAVLKVERVRYHPDKMQHRFGGQELGKERLEMVTEVFQIIDDMWTEIRK